MIEKNNIPEGWAETTLGEVAKIEMGQSPKSEYYNLEGKGLPFYQGVTEFTDRFVSVKNYTSSFTKIVEPNTILFSVRAPVGRVNFTKLKACIGRGNAGLNMKNNNQEYLYYLLKYSELMMEIYSSGTVFSSISGKELKGIPIIIPNEPKEQESIAAILTSFDDKIELLQAQNKTLEELAQTIFKEWFGKYKVGDKLPEGWREGKIGDLIEIRRGSSPRPIQDYISDSGYKWLKISDATATDSPYIFEIKEHIVTEGLKNTTLKKAGDLVLSNSATPGMPKILAIDTCVHDGWMHFPNSKVSNEYLYLLFLSIRPALIQHGSGSVFTNLKTDILREFEVVISTKDYYHEFDVLVKPIFNKIYNNALQIQTLTKTRDELLPKLMSGDIRVKMSEL